MPPYQAYGVTLKNTKKEIESTFLTLLMPFPCNSIFMKKYLDKF
jgi:hypothetical protein